MQLEHVNQPSLGKGAVGSNDVKAESGFAAVADEPRKRKRNWKERLEASSLGAEHSSLEQPSKSFPFHLRLIHDQVAQQPFTRALYHACLTQVLKSCLYLRRDEDKQTLPASIIGVEVDGEVMSR